MRNAEIPQSGDMKELRQEFDDFTAQWQDIRDEGQKDMLCVAGDPWDPKDKAARIKAGRPALSLDELGQYVNQLINDVRQNKRGIRVTPEASGADPKTAEFRQDLIRQIEYKSGAQSVYTTMFENTVQRSYGFFRVAPQWVSHRSDHQELRLMACPNPDLVTPDPYGVAPNGKDWKGLYFAESWKAQDFKANWPKAKVTDFGAAVQYAPTWIRGDRVMVAERWKVTTKPRDLHIMQMPPKPNGKPDEPPSVRGVFGDELPAYRKQGATYLRKARTVDYPYVTQQVTNGLEILEETAWPGTSIPFVGCYGKVLYVDEGDGAKRKILSLVRLARDPFMLYCYYRSCEMENVGLALKFPYFLYEGQISPEQEALLQQSNHEPVAVIKVKPMIDGIPLGSGPLPFPQRTLNEPSVQALELCSEAARRAIQAAMGGAMLPTQAQRHNEKSGVALKQIEDTAQQGNFHFIDHYDEAVQRGGEILDELISAYYDTPRDVTVRKPDDNVEQIRINDSSRPDSPNAKDGVHDVTISVGPAQASEREAARDFADSLIGSPLMKYIEPPTAKKLMALAIKLKDVGPMGDQMADLLSPPDQQDPNAASPQRMQQLQQENETLKKQVQQASTMLQTKQVEQQAKIQQTVIQEKAAVAVAHINNAAKIEIARISAAKEAANVAQEAAEERLSTGLEQVHDAQQAELDRQHEAALTAMQAMHSADASDQAHQQALAQGDASSAQAMAQQANQAALQPPPQDQQQGQETGAP